jgi:hypothetical protein
VATGPGLPGVAADLRRCGPLRRHGLGARPAVPAAGASPRPCEGPKRSSLASAASRARSGRAAWSPLHRIGGAGVEGAAAGLDEGVAYGRRCALPAPLLPMAMRLAPVPIRAPAGSASMRARGCSWRTSAGGRRRGPRRSARRARHRSPCRGRGPRARSAGLAQSDKRHLAILWRESSRRSPHAALGHPVVQRARWPFRRCRWNVIRHERIKFSWYAERAGNRTGTGWS